MGTGVGMTGLVSAAAVAAGAFGRLGAGDVVPRTAVGIVGVAAGTLVEAVVGPVVAGIVAGVASA